MKQKPHKCTRLDCEPKPERKGFACKAKNCAKVVICESREKSLERWNHFISVINSWNK